MNELSQLLAKYPALYHAAMLQYEIDSRNHIIAIGVSAIMFVISIVALTIGIKKTREKAWTDWPILIFIAVMLLFVSAGVLAMNWYGLWWMHANKDLYLWQLLLPHSN